MRAALFETWWICAVSSFLKYLTDQAPTTNHPALFCDTIGTDRFHWVTVDPPPELARTQMMECHFRFMHQMPLGEFAVISACTWMKYRDYLLNKKITLFCALPVPCTVTLNMNGSVWISLSQPVRALTPGQVTVKCYCIGLYCSFLSIGV